MIAQYKRGDSVNFYEKYLKQCKLKGASPSAAAGAAGLTKTSVTRWKNGSVPTDATILVLAEYFGCDASDLAPEETKKAPTVSGERPEVLGDDKASFAARTTVMVELFEQLSVEDQNDVLFELLKKARGLPAPDEHR